MRTALVILEAIAFALICAGIVVAASLASVP